MMIEVEVEVDQRMGVKVVLCDCLIIICLHSCLPACLPSNLCCG